MSLRCGTAFENPVTRAVACRYNAPVLAVVPGMTIKSSGEGVAQASGPVLSAYVVLLKPRVTALVVFTAGMLVAPDEAHHLPAPPPVLRLPLGAGAAPVINPCSVPDPDALMAP